MQQQGYKTQPVRTYDYRRFTRPHERFYSAPLSSAFDSRHPNMPFFDSPADSARLHYVDYRPSSSPSAPAFQRTTDTAKNLRNSQCTLVFIHGWPMSSKMYEHLTLQLCETYGIRCVASDRRGFGRSEWTGTKSAEITYDTFAADTVAFIEHLNFSSDESFLFVAASLGCGETLLAYQMLSDVLKKRCKGFLWMGPSCPLPLKTEAHPEGPPMELWDMILQGFRDDRVGFVKVALPGVFGMGPQFDMGIEVPASVLQRFEQIVWDADALAMERSIMIMVGRDFTEELKAFGKEKNGVKMVVLHGDNDQGKLKDIPVSISIAKLTC